jgi:Flp pilus assembly protein TadG
MEPKRIKSRRFISFTRNDDGGTLAELAILLPLLAVMLAAVSEFGRYFQTYNTLAKATRSSARYLSNHPLNDDEKTKAKNLVVCGKTTTCADNEKLTAGIDTTSVCIETTGDPQVETVTVRIPRAEGDCGAPVLYQPVFNIGALLHNSLTMALPIAPSTTMRYVHE